MMRLDATIIFVLPFAIIEEDSNESRRTKGLLRTDQRANY